MATDFRLGRLTLGSGAAFCIGDFMEQVVILPPGAAVGVYLQRLMVNCRSCGRLCRLGDVCAAIPCQAHANRRDRVPPQQWDAEQQKYREAAGRLYGETMATR